MAAPPRYTIGVLAGWQYYWTPTPLSYLNPIFRGIRRAAADWGCNLLLACGMGSSATAADPLRPAWFVPSPDSDFVPVGPWNTDGLIVVNPLHTAKRSHDMQSLVAAGHPVVFIGSGERGPTVEADNRPGIREAVRHLHDHGHREIAFIAGSEEDLAGDTGERLVAYHAALAELRLDDDERRCEYGRHTFAGGLSAARRLIGNRSRFTAVIASNDESALGALKALAEVGLRVPEDVAIVGFDDRPESALHRPSLSSVAVPLYELGFRAVEQLGELMRGMPPPAGPVRVPTRLVARESCGCAQREPFAPLRHASDAQSEWLIQAFGQSLEARDPAALEVALRASLDEEEAVDEEGDAWPGALDVAHRVFPALADSVSDQEQAIARDLANRAQWLIAHSAVRSRARFGVDQRWTFDRLGLLTARLLNTLDETEIYEILAEHLPQMGISFVVIGTFQADGDVAAGLSLLRVLAPARRAPSASSTRQFPPADLCPTDQPFSLALLPLVNPGGQRGFVAFETARLDLYGSIVQELAAALHAAALYAEAQQGRRLAEQATQMKSRFLSTVSHELRTPLNLIMGLSEILLRETSQAGPSQRRDLERLHANAQHLSRLISDVLDLASSDAGHLRLTYQFVDLGQVLGEVSETGRQLAIAKGLGWLAELPQSGPWVWGDRTRLAQVAMNLVSNAIKFTQHGEVRVALEASEPSVTVSVTDTGLGIPLSEQASIFDEFRRSERSIERGYSGLGLGLSICKRLVELHGGAIGVDSPGEEGAGSRFFFTLPLIEAPAELYGTRADEKASDGQVLVLSAQGPAGERLHEHLHRRGYEVQHAPIDQPSTWNALTLASLPSAIVLDVSTAPDQGWRVLKMLKANPTTSNVPVLFYTVATEDTSQGDDTARSASVLELDYLTKPIELANLVRALDQHWLAPTRERPVSKFLVVDDDPDTLEMHARIVRSRLPSPEVFQARNGREALRILSEESIDLVLLDLMMPEMDGFEVLEAMRDRPSTRDIPVIVVTGQTLSEPEMARLNLGVTKVLSKGLFSIEETLSHLDAALARRRNLSSEAQRLVRQAMAYMQARHTDPVSREEVAAHVGLSEDYLTSCFRKELGLTPVAYLNRYRVQQAKQLLKNTHKSITEIALEVGFSGSSYFSRVFHRETGMSPAEYRHT
jgi:signal transduction histidine kinase/CheY-like chemotaxis protein/ABC-type sugar transport system substrate-binding protein